MSNPNPEEPDPLLAFFMEPAPSVPLPVPEEPKAQPAGASALLAPSSAPAIVIQPAAEQIDRIERALEQSRLEIQSLTSQVATLVGAVADMNQRMSRPAAVDLKPAAAEIKVPSIPLRVRPRDASAIASVIVGLLLGVATWRYWSNGDATIAAPVDQAAVVVPPAPAEAPPAPALTKPPSVNAAPDAGSAVTPTIKPVSATAPIKYVGTLSIDSTPGGEVFIDRKSAGRTPLRVGSLRAGSHLIWVEREGYRRWTRVVQVQSDRVSRVSADLEPATPR